MNESLKILTRLLKNELITEEEFVILLNEITKEPKMVYNSPYTIKDLNADGSQYNPQPHIVYTSDQNTSSTTSDLQVSTPDFCTCNPESIICTCGRETVKQ